MTSAYENAMSNMEANSYTQKYPVTCEHGNKHSCYFCEHARAADLQARLDAMHSEHEHVTAEWKRTIDRAAQLETERDAERKERESLYPVLDEKSRVNESLRADIVKLEAERDELRGKLEQAQRDNERLMEVVRGLSSRLSEATA